jgi:hypothetical protein
MSRANPKSLCTKWVEQSDAMSDELHALEDGIAAAKHARDKYLHEHLVERKRLERQRDTAPIARSNTPFSIFADPRNDPR